ncbi:unnamed protein product [Musa acuminata var. zebrina]
MDFMRYLDGKSSGKVGGTILHPLYKFIRTRRCRMHKDSKRHKYHTNGVILIYVTNILLKLKQLLIYC